MKFYILFVENQLTYPVQDDLNKFFDYLKRKLNISVFPEYIKTNIPVNFKDFGVKVGNTSYYGLSGIKEELRNSGKISPDYYHIVFYLYDKGKFDKPLAAWTYPNKLEGAVFSEIPCTEEWETQDQLYRMLTHECLHSIHRLLWNEKVYTKDTMDSYRDEMIVESNTGNRAENIKELLPHLNKIKEPLGRIESLIKLLFEKVKLLAQAIAELQRNNVSKLDLFCKAIEKYEGYYPGSRSYRNNNPGNLHYASQQGTTGKDDKGFAVFDTYESGYRALKNQIKLAILGKSKYYKPEMTIIEFFSVYAPSHDNNDPNSYALFVAKEVGVNPQTKIREL